MARFISKITGEEITANGTKRNVTKQFLCDEHGNILHDKAREDDAEGVNRRIEVEAFKAAIRLGEVVRKEETVNGVKKWVYQKLFWEEFPGTIDQAESEMAEEMKAKAEIEKEYKEKLKKIAVKK